MVKLRKDLTGVVYFNGQPYKAGDTVPDGVPVGGHLTADGKDYGLPEPIVPAAAAPGVEPLTEAEVAEAEALGIPTDVHPERVRGAILGYRQGREDAESELEAQTTPETPPTEPPAA